VNVIKFIDISNFGSFNGFSWNSSVRDNNGDIKEFKKLNVIYGRNYAGKTTLSRIVRSLETGYLPSKFEAPEFCVTSSQGTIKQTDIPDTNNEIRVFNRDYIDENLSFLNDNNNGIVTPFAIIGGENKVIEAEILQKQIELGDEEQKTGLLYQLHLKRHALDQAQIKKREAENALRQLLTNKANLAPSGIKHNVLYLDPNYDIRKLNSDIRRVRVNSTPILSDEIKLQKEILLSESPLPDIENIITFTPSITALHEGAKQLVEKKISSSDPINELLSDSLLQTWVRNGIPLHKDKRNDCGFCGQPLPIDLWGKLDAHFNKESEQLEISIQKQIEFVENEKSLISTINSINANSFYSSFHTSYNQITEKLDLEINNYKTSLDNLLDILRNRSTDIFNASYITNHIDNSNEITTLINSINSLVVENNQKTSGLKEEQNDARDKLRLSEISQFIQDINLDAAEEEIVSLQLPIDGIEKETKQMSDQVTAALVKINELKIQLKDEKKGADKVNQYLNHYFGHDSLKLEAFEDTETSAYKFRILRGDKPAFNLSEGECGLVAFCYFIAKLEEPQSKGKKLIIYIDDPVSSLDSNHIFFVYGLINELIAAPQSDDKGSLILGSDNKPIYNYQQLIISTHNLEFLKYLKRLKHPTKDFEQFMIVRKMSKSNIDVMPNYLRHYITEFNHLFNEVYVCADSANATEYHHSFYGFGNNLRRFLEAFLFFKYPLSEKNDQSDYNSRIKMFFGDNLGAATLVQRITNEYSHLASSFDRSVQPIDHDEISKLANFVLEKLKKNDIEQYRCLLESIDKPDPLP
jgi:wobble nucleotide-excising tRNase